MKHIFLDTNIVFDLLSQREGFYEDAQKIFSSNNNHRLYISALTFANVHYLLQKYHSKEELRKLLRNFKTYVDVLSFSNQIIDLTLIDQQLSDFEDGLQYYTATENQIDIIITRDKKGFRNSQIPVMSAKEFLTA